MKAPKPAASGKLASSACAKTSTATAPLSASRMESGLGRVGCLRKHDQVLEMLIVRARERGGIGSEPLVLAARDHEVLDVVLAIGAAQFAFGLALRLHYIELVAHVLAFHRVVHNAVLVGAADADMARLVVERIFGALEATGELVQRLALKAKEKRNQRHAHRHTIGGLLEIDGAAVGVEGGVELADARQRMHDAGVGIFRLAQEFAVDLRVGLILVGPALLLEAGDVDRIDLLADGV